MKQYRNNQRQRKTQALLALLIYQLARGSFEKEPFADRLQQLTEDAIIVNPVDLEALIDAPLKVDLSGLLKNKKLEKKFVRFAMVYQRHIKETVQPADGISLTLGDILNSWADLTGQDKGKFVSIICPGIKTLLIEYNKQTGKLDFSDEQTIAHPKEAFNFMRNLLSLMVKETPPDKMNFLSQKLRTALKIYDSSSAAEVKKEIWRGASRAIISNAAATLSGALSANPIAKERISHPLFGTIIKMEADKYDWESGVSFDNVDKLQLILKEREIHTNQRILVHSLRDLGRKNIFDNVDYALEDKLMERLNKTIQDRMAKEQGRTKSTWVYSPISPEAEAQVEKRVRELIFRRDNNGTGRNH